MENSDSVVPVAVVEATTQPAPGADVQKPTPPEGEAPPENAAETTEQQEARKQSKFQRRLDRQKAARVAAETEARILRERIQQLEAQGKPAPQDTGEPKEGDFPDYTSYMRALTKWEAKQVVEAERKASREAQQGQDRKRVESAGTQKIAEAWAESEKTFQAAHKDYADVVGEFMDDDGGMQSFSREARLAIAELGPAVLYHLATNAEVADRIADLSPMRQVAELGKLESTVSQPAKRTTNAPPPASTVKGGKTVTQDLAKMSQAEYEAYRKSQGASWAR